MDPKIESQLKNMGMREYESKAYTTLLHKGICTAEHINKFSGIPLTRVYETLQSLEKRGLVVVLNTRPKRYKIVSIECLENLIAERKGMMKEEIKKLEDTFSSIRELAPKVQEDLIDSTKEDIWIYRGRENVIRRIMDAEKDTENEILVFSDDFSLFPRVNKLFRRKIREGVKIRLLCNVNEKTKENLRKAKAIGIEIRDWEVTGLMGDILDNRTIHIVSKLPREGVRQENHYGLPGDDRHFSYDCLTTKNPIMIGIMRAYFELFWKKGREF